MTGALSMRPGPYPHNWGPIHATGALFPQLGLYLCDLGPTYVTQVLPMQPRPYVSLWDMWMAPRTCGQVSMGHGVCVLERSTGVGWGWVVWVVQMLQQGKRQPPASLLRLTYGTQ